MVSGSFDVVIVGGGASGLMCALTAGRRGRRVLVVEHNNRMGRKILVSGGGRCNFTNLNVEADHYISSNPHFCKSALKRFTQWDFLSMVDKHGVLYEERDQGKLFCLNKSSDILEMLLLECEEAGVTFFNNTGLKKIETPGGSAKESPQFTLFTDRGCWETDALVIATGGISFPDLGATNYGYEVARKFGIPVLSAAPALVPFVFTEELKTRFARLAGISLTATLECNGKEFTGELLFTHRGISGPVVLQVSNYWQRGDQLTINFFPGVDLRACLFSGKEASPRSKITTVLSGKIPKKLVSELKEVFSIAEQTIGSMSDSLLRELSVNLTSWHVTPKDSEGFKKAEVTRGGVDTKCLSSKTMESTTQPGLYFVGEVVDVTGQLGGFNMQWAWSSGYAAGQYV